ncbi:MAG: hypothetical protein V1977_04295 [Candidatus Diapherotrites archaeon]
MKPKRKYVSIPRKKPIKRRAVIVRAQRLSKELLYRVIHEVEVVSKPEVVKLRGPNGITTEKEVVVSWKGYKLADGPGIIRREGERSLQERDAGKPYKFRETHILDMNGNLVQRRGKNGYWQYV